MQKLLKRTATAERQVARRVAKRNKLEKANSDREAFKRRMAAMSVAQKGLKQAQKRRREDWELGPLAPVRDTPIKDMNEAYYGALPVTRTMAEFTDRQIELACRWAGGKKYFCVKPGDRVAIIQGRDKGKIGTVARVDLDLAEIQMDDENLQMNMTISDVIAKSGLAGSNSYVQLTPFRVPIHAVRLVHPLQDPATNQIRDVVINELVPTDVVFDKPTGRTTWNRKVPALNMQIPWPLAFEKEERAELERIHETYESDTRRKDVEEVSFIPTLLTPPMPHQVLDELRNRYSKFRTRHEPEYIAKKQAEERQKRVSKGIVTPYEMRTPLQQLNVALRKERRARGQPELTDDMLVAIGKLMKQNEKSRFAASAKPLKTRQETPASMKPLRLLSAPASNTVKSVPPKRLLLSAPATTPQNSAPPPSV